MSVRVKKEQLSDNEDQVELKPNIHRVDVKAEEPAEYLLIIPPKEEPKEPENADQATTEPTASEDREWKCDHFDCDFVAKTKQYLLRHQGTHTKPFECKDCDKRFGTKEHLKNHRLVHHENPNAFQCKVCNKNLANKNSLKRHLETHEENPAKSFKCLKCQKTFRFKQNWKLHWQNKHSEFKPFACDLCPKKFAIIRQICDHVENHKTEKKFKCEVCSRSFAHKNNFNVHMERHAGLKFKCDLCDCEFSTKQRLKRHKSYMHSNSNQTLKCDKCNYVAKHPKLMISHQDVHKEWTEADAVECPKCKKKIRNKKSLWSHIRQVHSELQFKCDRFDCSYFGKTNADMKQHKESHEKKFKCNICEKLFSHKSELTQHNLIKHEDPDRFKCHVCDKRLSDNISLRNHLQTHEENVAKPFSCQQCSKSFRLKEMLSRHRLIVHGKLNLISINSFNNYFN